jgi:hypothetical protein
VPPNEQIIGKGTTSQKMILTKPQQQKYYTAQNHEQQFEGTELLTRRNIAIDAITRSVFHSRQ